MRNELFALWLLFGTIPLATAQVSVEINLPGASIGIDQPSYPELVAVPGYPVYYAPQVNSNYFFYDGMYWVYNRDNWYASTWYNGPWGLVGPDAVPLFILRIPVQYYREPPSYFHGWSSDAAPRWGEHWGDAWDQRRHGWDTWDHAAVPAPAPLPTYQRQYTGATYPPVAQQQTLQSQNYRYQPHEVVVHQAPQAAQAKAAPAPVAAPQARQAAPQAKPAAQQAQRGSMPSAAAQQTAAASSMENRRNRQAEKSSDPRPRRQLPGQARQPRRPNHRRSSRWRRPSRRRKRRKLRTRRPRRKRNSRIKRSQHRKRWPSTRRRDRRRASQRIKNRHRSRRREHRKAKSRRRKPDRARRKADSGAYAARCNILAPTFPAACGGACVRKRTDAPCFARYRDLDVRASF